MGISQLNLGGGEVDFLSSHERKKFADFSTFKRLEDVVNRVLDDRLLENEKIRSFFHGFFKGFYLSKDDSAIYIGNKHTDEEIKIVGIDSSTNINMGKIDVVFDLNSLAIVLGDKRIYLTDEQETSMLYSGIALYNQEINKDAVSDIVK